MIHNILSNYSPVGVSIWAIVSHNPVELAITILGTKVGLDKILIAVILAFIL